MLFKKAILIGRKVYGIELIVLHFGRFEHQKFIEELLIRGFIVVSNAVEFDFAW